MAEPNGFVCRKCGCSDLRVRCTVPMPNNQIRRYRYCRHCGTAKVTIEVSVSEAKAIGKK